MSGDGSPWLLLCLRNLLYRLRFVLPDSRRNPFLSLSIGNGYPTNGPNMLHTILCILTATAKIGYSLSNSVFFELFIVWSLKKGSGYFTIYPNSDKNLITGLPDKDEKWWNHWFFVKINSTSVNGLVDMLRREWKNSLGRT